MMRFRGGGVGHKSTREATNQFLVDCDPMDIRFGQQPESEDLEHGNSVTDSDSTNSKEEEDLGLELISVDNSESENDTEDLENREEEDYGYIIHDSDSDLEPGIDLDSDDDLEYTNQQGLDSLGAEDGIDISDPVEDLGFAEL